MLVLSGVCNKYMYWIDPFLWRTKKKKKETKLAQLKFTSAASKLPKWWLQLILAPKRLQANLEYVAGVLNQQCQKITEVLNARKSHKEFAHLLICFSVSSHI